MKCRICNRELKTEPYRSMGIGKICAKKQRAENKRLEQEGGDSIVPYDGGDIWIERLPAPKQFTDPREPPLLEYTTCSGLKTNIQRTEMRHGNGFNYGYGGSGPADTALNIMLMFTDRTTAQRIYQDFKWQFLGEQSDRLVIKRGDIENFIAEKKAELS